MLKQFFLRYLIADAPPMTRAERLRSALAGLAGFLLYSTILHVLPLDDGTKQTLAPLGATAVILFSLPHSPLAQPWSVFGGLMISATIGIACGLWIDQPILRGALAVSLSIGAMAHFRCIHPPSGAMALTTAVAAAQGVDPLLCLACATLNVTAMLASVLIVNNSIRGRRYPQCATISHGQPTPAPGGIKHSDLDAAMREMDAYIDVSEEDLVDIFNRATTHAMERQWRETCVELMRPEVPAVEFGTSLNDAWRIMRKNKLRSLPVIDRAKRVIGVLDIQDFLWHVEPHVHRPLRDNVRKLLAATPGIYSDKAEVVGQIMREVGKQAIVVRGDEQVATVLDRIARSGVACVPVLSDDNKLLGMLSLADVLSALRHRVALTQQQPLAA